MNLRDSLISLPLVFGAVPRTLLNERGEIHESPKFVNLASVGFRRRPTNAIKNERGEIHESRRFVSLASLGFRRRPANVIKRKGADA